MKSKHIPQPATIIAIVALFVALGGVGVAASGGALNLGKSNSATSSTSLAAAVAGSEALRLSNLDDTKSGSTALGLVVAPGHAPFTVDSSQRVTNLNADLLDGLHAKDTYWATGADSGQLSLPNAKGEWTTIAKTSFTISAPSTWIMFGQANVGFTTSGLAPRSFVNVRFLVNGNVEDDLVFPNTVDAGAVEALPAAIKCNARMAPGTYTVELQLEAYADDGAFVSHVGTLAVAGSGIEEG